MGLLLYILNYFKLWSRETTGHRAHGEGDGLAYFNQLFTDLNFITMKKLLMMFVMLVAPFAFTACIDDGTDDVKPRVELTDDEDGDDRGKR